jgi:peptide/nickel transport system substrate-binding protein
MKHIISAGSRTTAVTAIALAALVAGCSGGGSDTSGPVSNVDKSKVTTGTAKGEVGNVTWYGDYRPLYTFDPIKVADTPEETIIPNVCEPMLHVAPDYTISAGAVSYKQKDPTHLVLTLKDGVTFSNGDGVTVADIVYSLKRNLDPKAGSSYGYAFSTVEDITASGPKEVTISFNQPDATFVNNLGLLAGAILQEKFVKQAGDAFGSPNGGVMCTGPFTFTSYDGTSKLVITRNDNYWDKPHRAKAKSFTFVFPTDPSALANGLKSGEIDGGFNVPPSLITQLKPASTGQTFIGGEGSTPFNLDVLMTRSTGVLADLKVRRALSMALDRPAIAKAIFNGAADPLYKVSGPGVWGYSESIYAADYKKYVEGPDPAAAKKLIAEAGVKGKTATFAYPSGDPTSQQFATVLKQTAAEIGLSLKIVGLPNQQFGSLFVDPKARSAYDSILTKNYVELPEPFSMDLLYGGTGGATNFSAYSNKLVDTKLGEARAEIDDDKRAALVIEAEAQLAKDLPSIPVAQPRAVVFENHRITGSPLTFAFMSSPWAAAIGSK